MLVVVYGTLKQGYENNRLLAGQEFVKEVTVPGFMLYNSGFPVAMPEEGAVLRGELWDIKDDRSCLQRLDFLEGEGRMYNRTDIIAMDGEEELPAQMYVGHPEFWRGAGLYPCPKNAQEEYYWSRFQ